MEEKLIKYNEIKAEIDKLKWLIAVKEREEVQAGGPFLEITGIKAQGYKSNALENQIVKNVDEIRLYQKKIEELEAEIRMIDSMINILEGTEKQVVVLRYIKQLKWEGIAATINRDRAITKLDEIYNK